MVPGDGLVGEFSSHMPSVLGTGSGYSTTLSRIIALTEINVISNIVEKDEKETKQELRKCSVASV